MAGRKGHPLDPLAPTVDPVPAPGAVAMPAVTPGNVWSTEPALQPRPHLRPEEDAEAAEDNGKCYWFNPSTRAVAWTKEELVRTNRIFYAGISFVAAAGQAGPRGETSCYTKMCPGGQITAWTLEELFERFQRTQEIAAGGG